MMSLRSLAIPSAFLWCMSTAAAQETAIDDNQPTSSEAVVAPTPAPVDTAAPETTATPATTAPVLADKNTPPVEHHLESGSTPTAAAQNDAAVAALGIGESGARRFVLWRDDATGAYVKPIIWVSAGAVGYFPRVQGGNDNLQDRFSTLVMSRFGFEGAVNRWASFKLQFQRDLGFQTGTGPAGTGVWEGTASIQARENYVNLHRWGLTLIAGIATDPASIDFISSHVLDFFGADPYTRDPLLFSGFNMSQGVLLRYNDPILPALNLPGKIVYGFHITSGNPLTTSLSYGFGGNVSALGTLYTAPLRAFAVGAPGSNIHVTTMSPSLTYEVDFAKNVGLDIRLAAQFYQVNVDTASTTDAHLTGANYRGSMRLRLPYVNVFGNLSRRTNQQLPIPDITRRQGDGYESTVWSSGAEFNYGDFGIGGHYSSVMQEFVESQRLTMKYMNVAASYAIVRDYVGVTLRYAQLLNDSRGLTSLPIDSRSVILSLHLTI